MIARKSELVVGGFILAGGRSARFGRDKALVEVHGVPLLELTIDLMELFTKDVVIVGPPERYMNFGVEVVRDQWIGEGPLAGIITALNVSAKSPAKPEWNLIVSCDMPFLTPDWLAYMVERAGACPADVVLPKSAYGLEPLCACWRTRGAAKLQNVFEIGVRKITDAMKHLDMEVLDEAHWKRFDSAGRLFWNMNTPADYDEAKRILEAQRA
jgi:molybdopterin-guanine dinucleotide biosynthesis protein A